MPSNPWPTTSFIGWVQAGGTWVSRVLHLFHSPLMHLPCSGDWSVHSAMHFWLLMVWVVFQSAILHDLLLLGIRPCWIMGLPSPGLFCVHFVALLVFSCRTTLLFLLWCCLTQSCRASLGLLFISLLVTQCIHWYFSYTVCGLLCPIFLLGIFGPFAFLGLPDRKSVV